MPFHGTGAHTGAKQNAAAQATLENTMPTQIAGATYTTDEMSTVGTGKQTVVIGQAAGGNPGVTVNVQFIERTAFRTVDTFVLIPGGLNVTWHYEVPSRGMRLLINNPAGAPSGTVTYWMLARA